jgi:hypothetical protein
MNVEIDLKQKMLTTIAHQRCIFKIQKPLEDLTLKILSSQKREGGVKRVTNRFILPSYTVADICFEDVKGLFGVDRTD